MSKDPLFMTKLAGAVLVTAWVAVIAVFASWLLYQPGSIDTQAYPLRPTEVVDERPVATGMPESEPPAPASGGGIGDRLAAADPAAGAKVAKKCTACHSVDKGAGHKIGPNLWDVVGRGIGTAEGYKYSNALAEHGGSWGYEELDTFLASPQSFAQGTRMTFAGIRSESDRADLIAYLRGLSDNPPPLP